MSEFRIEKARSGRTRCAICHKVISNGMDRIVANLGTGLYPKNYHISCFVTKYADGLKPIIEALEGDGISVKLSNPFDHENPIVVIDCPYFVSAKGKDIISDVEESPI